MAGSPAPDVLLVSLGSTAGLRSADERLRRGLLDAGASVELIRAAPTGPRRTLMLTDLAWARAARSAAAGALARWLSPPRAVIYSTTTAALLWPRPGAIRFDAPSAGNRPGRHGLWQRPLEGRRLAAAPLLLPLSEGGLAEAPAEARSRGRALVLPVPVEPSGAPATVRDIAAVTYAANPAKKGLDRVLAAWQALREGWPPGGAAADGPGELLIAGVSREELARYGPPGVAEGGVRVVGALPQEDYRALLRRSRVFVCAPRREDYGSAQLEALADGCMLVSSAAPGPYAALPIARELDHRLIGEDLRGGLAAALTDPLPGYGERALEALRPYREEEFDRIVAAELLPRLLGERP